VLCDFDTDDHPSTKPPNDKHHQTVIMGRVRTKTVKRSAKVIIERYYPRLTLDFEVNKRICDEIAIIASKRLRNKVGFLSQSIAEISFSSQNRISSAERSMVADRGEITRLPATPPIS